MNKLRRKRLSEIAAKIEELKADLESIQEDEEEARDNMPESLQDSERYEAMDEACGNLGCAIDSLDEALEAIEEASA